MFDLVIIGGGPAGLSAAIHAERFKLKFTVIEKDRPGGKALAANMIENYPGVMSIRGAELTKRFIDQALSLGVKIEKTAVKKVVGADGSFIIRTERGGELLSMAVIIATGLVPKKIHLGGRKIYYYPVPEDIKHKGKKVLVIGGGDAAFDEAISFSREAAEVSVAMRSREPRALPKLVERALALGVVVKAGANEDDIAKEEADVVVACIGQEQNLDILDASVRATSDACPLAVWREKRATKIQLAGDILHPDIRHIAIAVGDGITAVEKIACKLSQK